ncbi:MAG: sodium/proline symporter [Xanthomonadales bacterium]|nr:sodium/proline symporter [Xanthomonadales bacterium]
MNPVLAVAITLVAYQLGLLAIGLWASRRTRSEDDFYLGGRSLGPWVAAISANASSSSAWTLVGVSGAAYAWGISAIWLLVGVLAGMALAWFYVAPRLRAAGGDEDLTLIDFLCGSRRQPGGMRNRRIAALIVLVSFAFYVSAQFAAAGLAFEQALELDATVALLIGVAVIVLYTLLGGFWAVSTTDLLQGLLMAAAAVVLPLVALVAVGGPGPLWSSLAADPNPAISSISGPHTGLAALGFAFGCIAIGTGHSGQPHVLNRFMALGDPKQMGRAQWIGMVWTTLVLSGMLLVGWCGRVLLGDVSANDGVLFAVAQQLLPPVSAGILVAAILSAIMSTADSQLLVAASCVTHDLPGKPGGPNALRWARMTVLGLSALSLLLALFAPQSVFDRVLFAWHAVGSAFAPLVLVRLWGKQIPPAAVSAVLLVGSLGTITLSLFPNTPGDWLERLAPFCTALLIALLAARTRKQDD